MKPNSRKLLIISPDRELLSSMNSTLSGLAKPVLAAVLARYPSAEELDQLAADHQPSALIIGLSDTGRALTLIEKARELYPSLPVACAHSSYVSEMILSGLRAGAREFLAPPVDAELLERLIEAQAAVNSDSYELGRLICFLPARGGCGGSTVALHVASAVGRLSGKKVLFVDFDFHTRTAELWLGLRPDFTLADAVRRRTDLHELWDKLTCCSEGMDILAPPHNGFSVQTDVLRHTMAVFDTARSAYDFVVCDLPPAVYSSSVRVLTKAEAVYLVTTPELMSLKLARKRLEELINLGIPAQAIQLIVNRLGADGLSLDVDELKQIIDIPIAATLPSDYKGLNKAIMQQSLVPEKSKLGEAFSRFAFQIARLSSAGDSSSSAASHFASLFARLIPSRSVSTQTAQNPSGLAP